MHLYYLPAVSDKKEKMDAHKSRNFMLFRSSRILSCEDDLQGTKEKKGSLIIGLIQYYKKPFLSFDFYALTSVSRWRLSLCINL